VGLNGHKSRDEIKYERHLALLASKQQRIAGLRTIMEMHCNLSFEAQDRIYIRELRHRIAATNNELRNMKG
jgi:hypothetical protein